MKNIFILPFLFLSFESSFSQINTINTNLDNKIEKIEPYDSLENICNSNIKQQIGQTLFLKENKISKEDVGSTSLTFYTKPTYDVDIEDIYKPIKTTSGYICTVTEYNTVKEKYFYVADVLMHPNQNDTYSKGKGCMKLIEKETKDTVYFPFNDFGKLSYYFLNVGYFEKLKMSLVGKELVYVQNYGKPQYGIKKNATNEILNNIPLNTIFRCTDIALENGGYYSIIVLLDNAQFGKVYVDLSYIGIRPDAYCELMLFDSYKVYYANEKQKKDLLIKKYGTQNAILILNGHVKIGMNKAMCIEAWGEPESRNKTINKNIVFEQWVYGNGNYLYFENGILKTIQN